jgi:Tfp pilus assembly protein PilO
MRFRGEIWRQRLWIWVPALLFFLANVVAFAVYTVGYGGRLDALDDTLAGQERALKELATQQRDAQAMLNRVRTNDQQVEQLYAERLSTRSRRLTGVTTEVKSLAQKAGLVPRTFSYPEQHIEEFGLIRRSYIFNVQGTYAELRKFINLIEASRSFLSINELRVSGNDQGPELDISIQISTLFTEGGEAGESTTGTTATETAATGPGGTP